MPKREAEKPQPVHSDEEDDESDNDDFGPMPAAADDDVEIDTTKDTTQKRPKKKIKKLEFEEVYLGNLPSAHMYEQSYMHRDIVTHIAVSKFAEFIITGSIDGHVKFWKKMANTIDFVKHYQAHLGPLHSFDISHDGQRLLTTSKDKTIKFFDIQSFDISNMIEVDYIPTTAVWLMREKVAIADADSALIRFYSSVGNQTPLFEINCHSSPVRCMALYASVGIVISADQRGMIEYWSADTGDSALIIPPLVTFKFKSDTDLYALAKVKSIPTSLAMAPSGGLFVLTSKDKQIRVFDFKTGKLKLQIDESAQSYATGGANHKSVSEFYDEYELGRRLAVERELESLSEVLALARPCFDESGHFLIYGSLAGIKILNLVTSRVVRVMGAREPTDRFLACALYQGVPKVDSQFLLSKAGADAAKAAEVLRVAPTADSTLYCTSFKKRRFYSFSTREPNELNEENRDVLNEAPTEDERTRGTEASDASLAASQLYRQAIIHTTMGDIYIKLFPQEVPKTIENFTTHAKNGYYNNIIFHRIIKGFMIQTGDPRGDGTGGESIWGGEFEDEFHRMLRHDRPYTVSMANAGPNTNGSQFFITTAPATWLDNKHTVFGRVTHGFDVIQKMENVRVNKNDRPQEEIKIIGIDVSTTAPAADSGK